MGEGVKNLSNDMPNYLHVVNKLKGTIHLMKYLSLDRSIVSYVGLSKWIGGRSNRHGYMAMVAHYLWYQWISFLWRGWKGGEGRGIFKLSLANHENYQFKALFVHFLTKVFHPNVGPGGEILLDILRYNWNPVYNMLAIVLSVQSLPCTPNLTRTASLVASIVFRKK